MTILNDLPEDHPLRNTALIDIGAEYRNKDSKLWMAISPAYTISKQLSTYNQLAPCWTNNDIWKATKNE